MGDPGDPRDWLVFARADLILAERPPPDGVLLELLGFHAQQAAEKALKAVLLARMADPPPRTHDLVLLLDLVGDPVPPISTEAAQRLTAYAVISRYPADLGRVEEDEWQRAVNDARAVVAWAEAEVAGA